MYGIYCVTPYSGVSPDSSAMLSPSDISIDPVDGDTVSSVCIKFCVHIYNYKMTGHIFFAKWQEMEKSKCDLFVY